MIKRKTKEQTEDDRVAFKMAIIVTIASLAAMALSILITWALVWMVF